MLVTTGFFSQFYGNLNRCLMALHLFRLARELDNCPAFPYNEVDLNCALFHEWGLRLSATKPGYCRRTHSLFIVHMVCLALRTRFNGLHLPTEMSQTAGFLRYLTKFITLTRTNTIRSRQIQSIDRSVDFLFTTLIARVSSSKIM